VKEAEGGAPAANGAVEEDIDRTAPLAKARRAAVLPEANAVKDLDSMAGNKCTLSTVIFMSGPKSRNNESKLEPCVVKSSSWNGMQL
jgi:hypothetical protein